MRKTFPLESSRHKPARVIEAIVSDIRKYLKRERRKELPEGVDFWDFDCRVGPDSDTAETVHISSVTKAIHSAPENDWKTVYVEILAKAAYRTKKEPSIETDESSEDVASDEASEEVAPGESSEDIPIEDNADDSTGLDG